MAKESAAKVGKVPRSYLRCMLHRLRLCIASGALGAVRGMSSLPPPPRGISAHERFLFDLNGFLVIRGVLSPSEVAAANAAIDAQAENMVRRDAPALRNAQKDSPLDASGPRMDMGGMLAWPKPHCSPFRRLLAHPKLVPYITALCGKGYRLDHQPLVVAQGKDSEGFCLHGGPISGDDGVPEGADPPARGPSVPCAARVPRADRFPARRRAQPGAAVPRVQRAAVDIATRHVRPTLRPQPGRRRIRHRAPRCAEMRPRPRDATRGASERSDTWQVRGSHKLNLPVPPDFTHGVSPDFADHTYQPATKVPLLTLRLLLLLSPARTVVHQSSSTYYRSQRLTSTRRVTC